MTKQIKTPRDKYSSYDNFKNKKLYPLVIYIYHFVNLQPIRKNIIDTIKLNITTSTLLKSIFPVKKVPAATPKNTWATAIKAFDQYAVFKEDLAILRKSISHDQIRDARIFNYPLTATQVKLIYNQGVVNFGPTTGAP